MTEPNKILKLYDKEFVKEYFRKKILPLYPDFADVADVKINSPKKNIWPHSYHVVIEFETAFCKKNGRKTKLPIYCAAHSEESRKNVYDAMVYLWKCNFSQGWLSIPHPLFYDDYFKGAFYRGVGGKNLYQLIREKKTDEVSAMIPKIAAWFAKLHCLPTAGAKNFNEENSRIRTIIPGAHHILSRIKERYPEYAGSFSRLYDIFIKKEEKFFSSADKRWLIHGDAHPENIIKMSERKIAVIDFSDLCLADFARDLGCFLQQAEYMCERKIGDERYTENIKKIFLENYLKNVKIKLSDSLEERINDYYNWTAARTAGFFFLKYHPEPSRAIPLLKKACANYKIKC